MTVKFSHLIFSFCFLLAIVGVQAGRAAAQTHASAPAPPSTLTRPDSIQDSGFYNYWAGMSAQGRAGGVLLGKLAMEGEPLPWVPMLVNVDCKGSIVNSTQADLKGQFVITFASTQGVDRRAQDAQRQMETKYEGCTVHASLAGFRSSVVTITARNLRDEPNLGTITLSSEARGGGTELSVTTRQAPSGAMKAFEKARADWLAQDRDRAERNLKKAVQLYPGFAEAWVQLGKIQQASDPKSAQESFSKALAADPNFVLPYEQLAALNVQSNGMAEGGGQHQRSPETGSDGYAAALVLRCAGKISVGQNR